MRESASQLASPLPSGSRHGADAPPENHAEMTRPGLLLPFTPGRSDEPSTGSASSNEGADQPIGPLLARPQLAGESTSFAERWARARDEITADEHQQRPELLVIDRRGGQPTRTAQSEALQRSSNGSSA